MKLRTLSIGLSFAVLLGVAVTWAIFCVIPYGITSLWEFPLLTLMMASCNFPPIVSIVISVCTQHRISQILSATASLLYGFFFANYVLFIIEGSGRVLVLCISWIIEIPILLPLWIAALVVDRRYRKKNQTIPSEP